MTGKTVDIGALQQRVYNQDDRHNELQRDFRGLESKVDAGFQAQNGKIDAGFLALTQKIDQKTTPNWQPVSIAVSIALAIFAALYYPVREALGKHDAQLDALRASTNIEVVRLWEAENRTARELAYLQGQMHPLVPVPPAR